jgi:DNA-binding beta-propeller fold protein YncE
MKHARSSAIAVAVAATTVIALGFSQARPLAEGPAQDPQFIPTGVFITPNAAPGSSFAPLNPDVPDDPEFTVDHAVSMAVSPDKKTLLVLTSGYNSQNFPDGPLKGQPDPVLSTEYVFVYDIQNDVPIKRQVLAVPNAFEGLAFNPNGHEFYVTGWVTDANGFAGDDVFVFEFDGIAQRWNAGPVIPLGHTTTNGLGPVPPAPAGLAVTADGARLIAANYENDSISIVNLVTRTSAGDLDLRKGHGLPGGSYPFWVAMQGNNTAFVSSTRDREIIVVTGLDTHPVISDRIRVRGEPTKLLLNREHSLLFVAEANRDAVAVISTRTHHLLDEINTTAPLSIFDPRQFKGSNPTDLSLSPDEKRLYVTNGGANSLAIIELHRGDSDGDGDGDDDELNPRGRVIGLVPTGWYPNAVAVDRDGRTLYVVNGKSNAGPDPQACRDKGSLLPGGSETACNAANQYVWQLTKAGFLTLPIPTDEALERLTTQVAKNNHYGRPLAAGDEALMDFLRDHIKHVIYIVKENRTYDQVLGDLGAGNGDPSLTVYPQAITPNQHALASKFVDFDNFYDSGEVSGDGWNWSTSAQANDTIEKTEPINYAGRGLNYDYEGTNRNVNVGYATLAERLAANPVSPNDENVLPGTADVSAPDGPDGEEGAGYLWDAALRSGLHVRNYGFFIDLTRYSLPPSSPGFISPALTDPFSAGVKVAFPTKAALQPVTDQYFRGYDNKFPDFYRVREWAREFDQFELDGHLPNLELLRVMHDHTGNFSTAIAGLNTPTIQTADNDYAVGLIVDKVSHSPRYADNTLICVIEDDAQDGPDHVDAHRSIALVAGAYVKRGMVVSKAYTTVNLVRTIVDVLGIQHFNINESSASPMGAIFQRSAKPWTFKAIVPGVLPVDPTGNAGLPLPASFVDARHGSNGLMAAAVRPQRDAAYWDEHTRGFDFTAEDRVDAASYNRILWRGIMGDDVAYPTTRSGADLRQNRKALLKAYERSLRQSLDSRNTSGQ